MLFDANLSPRLVDLTSRIFPGSVHVFGCGDIHADDRLIWSYAKENGLTIISKDRDFHQRSLLIGAPPKVIWLRVGNASTSLIASSIEAAYPAIRRFGQDAESTVLVI